MKYWFIFCKTDILLEKREDGTYTIPCSEESPVATKPWTHILNITPMNDGTEVKTFTIPEPVTDNPKYEMCGLRPSFYKLSPELYQKAGKCQELNYWDMNTQFCGVCGSPMKMSTDISKKCTECGKSVWPSLATAIIVLIKKGDQVLLVHARNFKGNFDSLVAGFVETGESLEEAVHREVMEETGLTIKNLKYFGSQPWPFPSGLMVGYTAEYVDGEIHLQKEELSRGKWFSKDNLPVLPEKLSIARKLIDAWLENRI
jgi:hydrolase, NUDIX family|nr:NAD(+) diphosphatase [Segatella copri]DAG06225.1 MAG TPA: NADH pyrophosphatase [Siphoviridae sp. ct3z32]